MFVIEIIKMKLLMNQSHPLYTKIQFPLFALHCRELLVYETAQKAAGPPGQPGLQNKPFSREGGVEKSFKTWKESCWHLSVLLLVHSFIKKYKLAYEYHSGTEIKQRDERARSYSSHCKRIPLTISASNSRAKQNTKHRLRYCYHSWGNMEQGTGHL